MSEQIGSATIQIRERKIEDVPVYAYHDPETNINYRSIFISELPNNSKPGSMPKIAKVKYRGNSYKAIKYGNPNNQVPTYDWKVENKV